MSTSYREVKTPINSLRIYINKVVIDERGFFCDLAEADNPIWKDKVTHLHASIAIKKGVARGGHYHYRLKENFYILSGTALFIFHDFNEKSKTFGRTWAVILGFSPENKRIKLGLKFKTSRLKKFYIDRGKLAQIEIAPYIYHAFWPLTNEKVVAFVTGTTGYDPSDFEKPNILDVPNANKILKKFNIKI